MHVTSSLWSPAYTSATNLHTQTHTHTHTHTQRKLMTQCQDIHFSDAPHKMISQTTISSGPFQILWVKCIWVSGQESKKGEDTRSLLLNSADLSFQLRSSFSAGTNKELKPPRTLSSVHAEALWPPKRLYRKAVETHACLPKGNVIRLISLLCVGWGAW